MSIDRPKALGDARIREARRAALDAPHMHSLVGFVQRLRELVPQGYSIPDFDPLDGGENAELMFVLEAPGPQAIASGFVSRDNPDETAKNFRELLAAAGIARNRTALWNIVPWYIGEGGRIRPARGADIREGIPHLLRLIALLPRLQSIILVGRKAQRVSAIIAREWPTLSQFSMAHPSPVFVNRAPQNRARLEAELRAVAQGLRATQMT